MAGKRSDIDFVMVRFPDHAVAIESLAPSQDFQELCEHLVLMWHLEREAGGGVEMRFQELRQDLEDELLDWVLRIPPTHH